MELMETEAQDACTLEDVILCQHRLQEIILRETMLQEQENDNNEATKNETS